MYAIRLFFAPCTTLNTKSGNFTLVNLTLLGMPNFVYLLYQGGQSCGLDIRNLKSPSSPHYMSADLRVGVGMRGKHQILENAISLHSV